MKEFIIENKLLLIIIGVLILTFLISLLFSVLIRKKQIKKDLSKPIEKSSQFEKYNIKTIDVNNIDISNVKFEIKQDNNNNGGKTNQR